MRPFEWLLLLGTLGALGVLGPWSWQVRGPWRWRLGYPLIGLTVAAMLVHVFVEGTRWQLTIVYVTIVVFVLVALRHPLRSAPLPQQATLTGPVARGASLAALLALVLSGIVAWSLPVPALEPPLGVHPVGTRSFALTDASRAEIYSDADNDVRRFPVQVWYPTNRSDGQRAPLTSRPDVLGGSAATWLGLPAIALSHLDLAQTNSIVNAPIATSTSGTWPVVIYSHGWGGFRTQHVSLLERLAANGYVVFAIDHTYGALTSVFPDGHAVPINMDTLPPEPVEAYMEAARVLVDVYARDIGFLVAELQADSLPVPIAATDLGLEEVALIGHSAGGGAATLACTRITTCAGLIGFDPWVDPLPDDVLSSGVAARIVSLRSSEWMEEPNDDNLRRLHASSPDQRLLRITNALHQDFTMASDLTPWAQQVGLTGETGGSRVREIAEQLALDTLAELLQGRSPIERSWPEVEEG